MPIYQTNDYTLFQIKEKYFIDKFKSKLNKTCTVHTHTHIHTHTHTHTHMETNIHINVYMYIHTQKYQDTHSRKHREK